MGKKSQPSCAIVNQYSMDLVMKKCFWLGGAKMQIRLDITDIAKVVICRRSYCSFKD